MKATKKTTLAATTFALILIATVLSCRIVATPQSQGLQIVGTWAIALDTAVFDIPGGTFRGVASFHSDGTMTITDAGDLGSFPFASTDTAQQGVWRRAGPQAFESSTLFLRKDEVTGEVEGWHRVLATWWFDPDADHLTGFAEEQFLECPAVGATPFKLLNCPDPTTGVFETLTADIPLTLARLRVD